MIFEQPFYIPRHAVDRFRERIPGAEKLSARTIRIIIQGSLQPGARKLAGRARWNHARYLPVYEGNFCGTKYLIPVVKESWNRAAWPVVSTILMPWMNLKWEPGDFDERIRSSLGSRGQKKGKRKNGQAA